ncbi:hypothetical protein TWF225_001224 [Orbilia oligospora]|nr:hypothetical protein TWF225_001224 [Orbilia oligospora]KAF3234700.1 hypothetical protein TWF128_002266 [Orbilia oligospora]KAF3269311.1 hypothetical protein TWF217_009399 [Orbilia oligospora]KAF3291618.1 hypothetical protein TWF132_006608 [Orbilia oligospora]
MKSFSIIAMILVGVALAAPAPAPDAVAEPASTSNGYVYCYQCRGEPKICLPYIPIINPCTVKGETA